MADWVAVLDINSLYPNCFRALNMSPETIVGYIQQDITEKLLEGKNTEYLQSKARSVKDIGNAEKWAGIFNIQEVEEVINKTEHQLTLCFYSGEKYNLTANQIWEKIVANNWLISANGVIFRTDKEGIIPGLLARWYSERKGYQKTLKEYIELSEGIEISEKTQISLSKL